MTTEVPSFSRRNALKLIGGAPLISLPVAAGFAASPASAMQEIRRIPPSASFNGMPAPTLADPAAMSTTTVSSTLTASYDKGLPRTFTLGYETFFLTGTMVPRSGGGSILAGGYVDIDGQPIVDTSYPGGRTFFSDCPDGTSLVTIPGAKAKGAKGNTVFAVVQFEYTTRDGAGNSVYGQLPSPIAVLTLDQDPESGKLSLLSYHNVDTSPANGLWITCGASRSPWNTHLSSEEYEPDATTISTNTQFQAFSRNLYGDPQAAKPYRYGHLPEVSVHPDGTGTIVKHYCLGRISHELVQVMPDERTVLMGDDATNGGLFLFIADRPRDLSAGTLYVAKWWQKTAANGGSADLTWIRLGHATSAEIEALAGTLTAADIVDVKTADPLDPSYAKIPYSGKTNWVKWRPGMALAAAFLETHRYAAYKGGSLGFTKMEGTTVNVRDKIAYSAISYVQTAMTDGSGGIAIQGPQAGMVYAWPLQGGQVDDTGARMKSQWVPVSGAPLLIGEDLVTADALGNLSNPEMIANPDNIKFSERQRTLFIGEDSGRHVNNFLWAYNVDTRRLSRLLSCPSGAESTGLHAVDDVNGFSYIMSNFQHPGDWELTRDASGNVTGGLHAQVYATLDPLVNANYNGRYSAAVGYLVLTGQA